MGREKGSLNRLLEVTCYQCGRMSYVKKVNSVCDGCKLKNKREYHRKYMKEKFYNRGS